MSVHEEIEKLKVTVQKIVIIAFMIGLSIGTIGTLLIK